MTSEKRLIDKLSEEKLSARSKILSKWEQIKECLDKGYDYKAIFEICKKEKYFNCTYPYFTTVIKEKELGYPIGKSGVRDGGGISSVDEDDGDKTVRASEGDGEGVKSEGNDGESGGSGEELLSSKKKIRVAKGSSGEKPFYHNPDGASQKDGIV